MAAETIVGIDLGTTNSVVAVMQGDDVRFLENFLGDVLTPSAVAVDSRDSAVLVGRTARDMVAVKPQLGKTAFKRAMGMSQRYALGARQLTPVELSAHVLDALRQTAELRLGTPVTRCVVTVPAYFDEAQRFATKCAANLAGFTVERILNEPTAAAIAYGLQRRDDESVFLVFDLGGGTFDVCVMELFEGVLEVKGVAGISSLGGEDFTRALLDSAIRRGGGKPTGEQDVRDEDFAVGFRRAELLKRQLSSWPEAEIVLPGALVGQDQPVSISFTAEQADEAYSPLLERLHSPCRAALLGANVAPGQLDDIVLVGGATRMPSVRRFVRELFGRDPSCELDPDLVVARGAAIQAALCGDNAAVEDIVVTDVASHSLGVAAAREIGGRLVTGYFEPIIHRNTILPTSRVETMQTVERNQRVIEIDIYEGEARRVEQNRKLGNIRVTGVPRGPEGQPIDVRFTYDVNGMLEVEAVIQANNKAFSAVFQRTGETPDDEQMQATRERMQELKADPLQQPRYRDAEARAQILWSDLSDRRREQLGEAMDRFEAAISSRNPQEIERAYKILLDICEQLDGGIRW